MTDSQFFEYPINYRTGRNAYSVDGMDQRTMDNLIIDNNYKTFSTENKFFIDTYGSTATTPTDIDHIYIKGKGITNYSLEAEAMPTNITLATNRVIPTTVTNALGDTRQTTINSVQHDLFSFTNTSTTGVTITFTGSVTIYEIMLLKLKLSIPSRGSYDDIKPSLVDRGGLIRTNLVGQVFKRKGLGSRFKKSINFSILFPPTYTVTIDQFLGFLEEHPDFTYAQEYNDMPDEVWPAIVEQIDYPYEYRSRNPASGFKIPLRISEI